MKIGASSRVRMSDQAVARELSAGEGGVVLHLESAQYFGLNQVGMLIWELLDREQTVRELVERLRPSVAGAPDHLEQDVIAFLEAAQERGVVVVE